MHQRILFVCSMNKLRSPTAEAVFSALRDIEVDSAGTAPDAYNHLTRENVEWATHIVCMEHEHGARAWSTSMEHEHAAHVRRHHRAYLRANVVVLDIPDEYDYMEYALVWKLEKTMARWYRGQ